MGDLEQVDQNQLINTSENSLTGIRINDIYEQPSLLFGFGVKEIIMRNKIKLASSLIKLFLGFLIILLSNTVYANDVIKENSRQIVNPIYLSFWTYVVIIHSLISAFYFMISQYCFTNKSINLELARALDQVLTVFIPDGVPESQVIEYLDQQVKYLEFLQFDALLDYRNLSLRVVGGKIIATLHQKYLLLKITSKLLFLVRTLYLSWALSLLLTDLGVEQTKGLYLFYNLNLIIVVLIELYLYLKLYVLIILYLTMLPVTIYRNCLQKRKQKQQIVDQWQEIQYQQQLQEEQCSICLQNYQDKEMLFVLTCSDKHKFHKKCIVHWLVTQKDCPLCRKQFD